MLTKLKKAPANVVAITIDGKLGNKEIDRMIELVDAKLAKHPVVHIFAEYGDFEWPSADALRDGFAKGWHLFSRLRQFGRVAIVSDRSWIRIAARIESALLPHLHYETFSTTERDQAFAWVCGDETGSPAAITILPTEEPFTFAFEVDGKLTRSDLKLVLKKLDAAIDEHGSIRLLARIKNLEGLDWSILTDPRYPKLKAKILKHVERYAIVGGPDWLDSWVEIFNVLAKAEIQRFELKHEDKAWEWLREAEVGARPRSNGHGRSMEKLHTSA